MEQPPLDLILKYARCFDGYHAFGGFELLAELANERHRVFLKLGEWEGTARELRGCLFFEERRWTHFGWSPEGEELKAIELLFQTIQAKVRTGDLAPNDAPAIKVWGAPPVTVDGVRARLLEWRKEGGLALSIAWDETGEVVERKCPPCQITPDDPAVMRTVGWLFEPDST